MCGEEVREALFGARQWGPWTTSGPPDPDSTEPERQTHQVLLTDPSLLTCFRRRFPHQAGADYDEMVRALGYVWDCRHDGIANVTGFCCARCGRTRALAAVGAGAGRVPV